MGATVRNEASEGGQGLTDQGQGLGHHLPCDEKSPGKGCEVFFIVKSSLGLLRGGWF